MQISRYGDTFFLVRKEIEMIQPFLEGFFTPTRSVYRRGLPKQSAAGLLSGEELQGEPPVASEVLGEQQPAQPRAQLSDAVL